MIFVGDDWAEDHHDVYVMDADGRAAGVASAARRSGWHTRVRTVAGPSSAVQWMLSGGPNTV